ncbi:hypothetical protein FACS189479_04460 [Spirochaetia bacterium]|nr:hypothetical protein FACS189479_04460 [Spirochaetia bacterium]
MTSFDVKDAIDLLLKEHALTDYQLFTSLARSADAVSIEERPFVYTVSKGGSFPKKGSRQWGPYRHEGTLRILFTVAASYEVDLSIIDNPQASPVAVSAAMAQASSAELLAQQKAQFLCDRLFNIIMNPTHADLLIGEEEMNVQRWITDYVIGDAEKKGGLACVGGYFTLTFQTEEYTDDAIPQTGRIMEIGLTSSANVNGTGFDEAKAGVEIDQDNSHRDELGDEAYEDDPENEPPVDFN